MIYLDTASTRYLSEEMITYLTSIMHLGANPSSLHSEGQKSRQIITESRKQVARFLNADESAISNAYTPQDIDLEKKKKTRYSSGNGEIIFTGSASASTTLAVRGWMLRHGQDILFYSSAAHSSLLKCGQACNGFPIPVDSEGFLNLDWLEENLIKYRYCDIMVAINASDSEIGTVQGLERIDEICSKHNVNLFIDATAYVPCYPINMKKFKTKNIALSFAGHKIGAMKGIGVLYNRNLELEPLVYGEQESGLVGGTQDILSIGSLGKACEIYEYKDTSQSRDYLWHRIQSEIQDCYLVGPSIESGKRLPNNIYSIFRGIEGESLMMLLDCRGICVSTGSACSSGSMEPSVTLKAIGIPDSDIHSGIRMTLSGNEAKEELDYVVDVLKESVAKLRSFKNG